MPETTRPRARLVLWCLLGALVISSAALVPLGAFGHELVGAGLVSLGLTAPFAVVGLVVARRAPENPIGWMLIAIALIFASLTDVGMYAVRSYRIDASPLPLARVAVALSPFAWQALLLLLPLLILLFPDGKLPSRRWRVPFAAYLAVWAVVLGSTLVADRRAFTGSSIRIDDTGELEIFNHSTGWFGTVAGVAVLLYPLFVVSFLTAQVLAFRRAAGDRRVQLKWLLAGATLSTIGLVLQLTTGSSTSPYVRVLAAAGFVASVALPVAMGVAILKYRLYDVDRLISRTLSYTIVTILLAAVFLAIVLLATQVLPFSSPVGVAASTLAAAALFGPLRARVQRAVDRRFNRARYDAEAIVSAFSSRLRGASDLEAVHVELLGAVERSMEPAHASVWISPEREPRRRA